MRKIFKFLVYLAVCLLVSNQQAVAEEAKASDKKISKICVFVSSKRYERVILDCGIGGTTDHLKSQNIELGVKRADFSAALGWSKSALDTIERNSLLALWQDFQTNGLVLEGSASSEDLDKIKFAYATMQNTQMYRQYEPMGYSYFNESSLFNKTWPSKTLSRLLDRNGKLVVFHDNSSDTNISIVYSAHVNVNQVEAFALFTVIVWS